MGAAPGERAGPVLRGGTRMTTRTYTAEERLRLVEAWQAGIALPCPRCGAALETRPVPRPEAVSYVRTRSWLTCPGCGRGLVADDPKGDR
jgi:hypothetical protein